MFSEMKTIDYSYYTMSISWVIFLQSFQNFILNFSIIYIKFFISANFQCNFLVLFFNIETFYYLPKGSLVNNITYLISITNLFANSCSIVTLRIRNFLQSLPSKTTDSKYLIKLVQFSLFKHCQLIRVFI